MNPYSTALVDPADPNMGAEEAWRLWHQLTQLAESIWQKHEMKFLEFCIQEEKDQCYIHLPPSD